MTDKSSSMTLGDAKQKIAVLDNPSTPLETKKLDVELLLNLCVKSNDFANIIKENNGILVLTTLFKSTTDFDLKTKITTLLVFLSLNGHSGATTESLMNDFAASSLVNLFLEKDFNVFLQAFGGLKAMGNNPSKQGGNSLTKSGISLNLSTGVLFLENIASIIDSSSKLLSDSQKSEILVNFTQFVLSGVLSQAAADAAKDSNSELGKNFSLAYGKFVKSLESCRSGDFSNLDMVVNQILQLIKDGKLIAVVPGVLGEYLTIINQWLEGKKKFNPLYKASSDGFTAAAFHQKCDNKGPTVTIITCSQGYVFGGYTPLSWDSSGSSPKDTTNLSFLFSLKNPRNEQPKKFPLKQSHSYCMYNSRDNGPVFGSGHDICCYNNSNSCSNNYLNFGHAYDSSPFTCGSDGKTAFTGNYNFTAKEIEVYQVQ